MSIATKRVRNSTPELMGKPTRFASAVPKKTGKSEVPRLKGRILAHQERIGLDFLYVSSVVKACSSPRLFYPYSSQNEAEQTKECEIHANCVGDCPEITEKMSIAKSSVHHHLITLRTAGLVIVYLSPNRNDLFRLREEVEGGLSEQLWRYLREGTQ